MRVVILSEYNWGKRTALLGHDLPPRRQNTLSYESVSNEWRVAVFDFVGPRIDFPFHFVSVCLPVCMFTCLVIF